MAVDKKHLRQRGNIWWLHYRIPERHKLLPECIDYKDILPKSLETDSLREARRRRDVFLHGLEAQAQDHYKAWLPKREEPQVQEPSPRLPPHNPLLIPLKPEHPNISNVKAILMRGSATLGDKPTAKKLKSIAGREREAVLALLGEKRQAGKSIKSLTKAVVRESEARGLATKTISKLERSSSWFLESIMVSDIDIDLIEFEQVSDCLIVELEAGVSGSTLNGHLWGLSKMWNRAKRAKLVNGDNPFSGHKISKKGKSYDPFTMDEIRDLYHHADPQFKTLIHAGATTGARIGEMLRAEVKVLHDQPCWLFNFKEKGKTEQSTRIVPIHDSLKLPEGFTFKIPYRSALRTMREHVDTVLGIRHHELSGEPRKLSFHSFRSTIITQLRRMRYSDKAIGSITGHLGEDSSKGGSLPVYDHVEALSFKKELVDQLKWIGE